MKEMKEMIRQWKAILLGLVIVTVMLLVVGKASTVYAEDDITPTGFNFNNTSFFNANGIPIIIEATAPVDATEIINEEIIL